MDAMTVEFMKKAVVCFRQGQDAMASTAILGFVPSIEAMHEQAILEMNDAMNRGDYIGAADVIEHKMLACLNH